VSVRRGGRRCSGGQERSTGGRRCTGAADRINLPCNVVREKVEVVIESFYAAGIRHGEVLAAPERVLAGVDWNIPGLPFQSDALIGRCVLFNSTCHAQ